MISLESYKSSNLLPRKNILRKSFSATESRFFQLPTYPTTGEIFLTQPACDQNSVFKPCRILKTFPIAWSDVQLQKNPILFKILQSFQFILFPPRSRCFIKLWSYFQEDGLFRRHCALHRCGEHRDSYGFWLWCYLLPWSSYNSRVLLMNCVPLRSFWTRIFYGTWIQQLLIRSTTLRIRTLCQMGTLKLQLNNLEDIYIQCSLHCERWTLKGRDFASLLHSCRKITYRTVELRKQSLQLKSWLTFGSMEHWMEFHRLWWTLVV